MIFGKAPVITQFVLSSSRVVLLFLFDRRTSWIELRNQGRNHHKCKAILEGCQILVFLCLSKTNASRCKYLISLFLFFCYCCHSCWHELSDWPDKGIEWIERIEWLEGIEWIQFHLVQKWSFRYLLTIAISVTSSRVSVWLSEDFGGPSMDLSLPWTERSTAHVKKKKKKMEYSVGDMEKKKKEERESLAPLDLHTVQLFHKVGISLSTRHIQPLIDFNCSPGSTWTNPCWMQLQRRKRARKQIPVVYQSLHGSKWRRPRRMMHAYNANWRTSSANCVLCWKGGA